MNPKDAGLIYVLFGLGSLVTIHSTLEYWSLPFIMTIVFCSFIPIVIGMYRLLPDKPKQQKGDSVNHG